MFLSKADRLLILNGACFEHNIYAKDTDREWDIGFRLVKEL